MVEKHRLSVAGTCALFAAAALATPVSAAVIGPNLTVSNASPDTGERLNIDTTFTQTLQPGTYSVDNFSYVSVGAGLVRPFLATLASPDTYNVLWMGGQVVGGATGTVSAATPGFFKLSAPTTVYAGFYTPAPAGGRVDFSTQGTTTAHDDSFSPPQGGLTTGGFAVPALNRQYAFNVTANASNHQVIGPGLLSDTVSDTAGQDRLNVDQNNTLTLGAGTYDVADFSFIATAAPAGSTVVPFLARLTANDTYQTVWVGQAVSAALGGNRSDPTGGFTLETGDTLYAGFYTTGAASLAITLNTGTTDHDNAFTGPVAAGETVSGFSNPSILRQYSFSIAVDAPEPGTFGVLGVGAASLLARRRRRRRD
jgi:hypothetical protein